MGNINVRTPSFYFFPVAFLVDLVAAAFGTLVDRVAGGARSLLVARTREEARGDLDTTGVAAFFAGVAGFFAGEAGTALAGEAARRGEEDLVTFAGLRDRVAAFLAGAALVFLAGTASTAFGAAVFFGAGAFFDDFVVGALVAFIDSAAAAFFGDNLASRARPASDLEEVQRATILRTYFKYVVPTRRATKTTIKAVVIAIKL